MANFTLNLGTLDLTPYVRVDPADGLDPAGDPLQPQFADTPLGVGEPLSIVQQQNREWVIPVHLKTTDKPSLHALVRTIRETLDRRPVTLEWADAGADESTFYDVQWGKLVPEFNYRRGEHFILSGKLHVWTGPYGHTGTTRIVATAVASMARPVLTLPVPSVAGDVAPLLHVSVSCASAGPGIRPAHVTALSRLPHPSYVVERAASGWDTTSLVSYATLVATGAFTNGNLVVRAFFQPGVEPAASHGAAPLGISIPVDLPNYPGRNRVLAIVRPSTTDRFYVSLKEVDDAYALSTTTAVATQPSGSSDPYTVDLGTFDVPTAVLSPPTQMHLDVCAWPVSSTAASQAIDIAGLYIVPDAQTVMFARGAADVDNSYEFDGINSRTYAKTNTPTADVSDVGVEDALRGSLANLDLLTPSQGALAVLGLPLPDAQDAPFTNKLSVTVSVREQFTYAR